MLPTRFSISQTKEKCKWLISYSQRSRMSRISKHWSLYQANFLQSYVDYNVSHGGTVALLDISYPSRPERDSELPSRL